MVIEIAGYVFFQVKTENDINDNGTLAAVASLVASSLEGGLVSLPLNKYGKVAVDFCSGQSATKEPVRRDKAPPRRHYTMPCLYFATEKQRRYEQKDQDLVYSRFSGNDTSSRRRALSLRSLAEPFPYPKLPLSVLHPFS